MTSQDQKKKKQPDLPRDAVRKGQLKSFAQGRSYRFGQGDYILDCVIASHILNCSWQEIQDTPYDFVMLRVALAGYVASEEAAAMERSMRKT